VLGIEKSVVAGELLSAGNGATAPELAACWSDRRPAPLDTPMPSICTSTARKHRYSFGWQNSLRVPKSFSFGSAVPGGFCGLRFSVLKAYFLSAEVQMRFPIFTELPLNL